jgi:hypothetical protein
VVATPASEEAAASRPGLSSGIGAELLLAQLLGCPAVDALLEAVAFGVTDQLGVRLDRHRAIVA